MTPAFPAVLRSRWFNLAIELLLAALVAWGSFRLAYTYLNVTDAPTFIDWELKPAAMHSCGYGLTVPAGLPAVTAFIARKSGGLSCQEFAWGGAPTPAIRIALTSRYSLYGASWAMRLWGISWETLDRYLALLFAFSMACVYGIYRMAAGRVLSVFGVAAVACSVMLMEIGTLRDFVKLPCFAALWLMLAWVMRRGFGAGAKAMIVPMAVGGALLGVGIGLRMDALVLVPPFVIIALIVPGFSWRDLALKTAAIVLFIAAFLATGSPILKAMSSGANSAHVVVLGLMQPFDAGLSIEPAPYDVGAHYSDGYAYTVVVSDALQARGEKMPILLGSPEDDRVGGRFLGNLARQFPGDVLTRGIGATLQTFRFHFDWRIREQSRKLRTFEEQPRVRAIGEWRDWALGFFENRELEFTLMVLILACAFNWRLGGLGFLLILYFCSYSMLQFSRRHMFHLDVIPILMAVLAVQLPLSLIWRTAMRFRESREAGIAALRGYRRQLIIGSAVLAGVMAVFAVTVWGARQWQQSNVTRVVEKTLATKWVPAPTTDEPLIDTVFQNGNPTATWYETHIKHPDWWKTARLLRVAGFVPVGAEAEAPPELRQQYFKVTLNDRCNTSDVTVATTYSAVVQTYDLEYHRTFTVPVSGDGPAHLLVPAFYHLGSSWTRFDGFGIPLDQQACITAIERAEDTKSLELPVVAFVLAPDWRERPLRQQLLNRAKVTISGTPVDPLPDDLSAHRSGWRKDARNALAVPMPPLDQWDVSADVALSKRGSGFEVASNHLASGYQLMSPPLDVPAKQVVSIQIVGEVINGEMCVGVLDGAQQRWLLAPTPARVGLLVNTGDFTQIRMVFSNCAKPPGLFRVRSITYQAFPQNRDPEPTHRHPRRRRQAELHEDCAAHGGHARRAAFSPGAGQYRPALRRKNGRLVFPRVEPPCARSRSRGRLRLARGADGQGHDCVRTGLSRGEAGSGGRGGRREFDHGRGPGRRQAGHSALPMSRPDCAAAIGRCRRRSTASSPIGCPTCC